MDDLTGPIRLFLCSSDMDVTSTSKKFDTSGTVGREGGRHFAAEVLPVPTTTVSCPAGAGSAGTVLAAT